MAAGSVVRWSKPARLRIYRSGCRRLVEQPRFSRDTNGEGDPPRDSIVLPHGVGEGDQTLDIYLGKVALCQTELLRRGIRAVRGLATP